MSSRGLRIHLLETRLSEKWRQYVDRHPEATFFHGLGWKRAVQRTFGHRSWYLLAEREGRIVGVLPLFEINSFLAGRFLVSVPYATYGGLLSDGRDIATALFRKAEGIGTEIKARSIELRSIEASVPGLESVETHAMFRKALPSKVESVIHGFPRKARAAARRAAQRHGLEVEFNREELPTVWRLYVRSMHRLGSVNYPYQFFEELVSAAGDECVVQIVRYRSRPVAGLLTFLHRETVMPYFAGLDERESLYGLNNYLYLKSMEWSVEKGYRVYDFGRTRYDNVGCFNFKRFCGFEPTPLHFQVRTMPGSRAPDLSPASPKWTAARKVWRALPLPITRPLGGWLAKSIPG